MSEGPKPNDWWVSSCKGEIWTQTHTRGECCVNMTAEIWMTPLQAKKFQASNKPQKLGEKQVTASPPAQGDPDPRTP